MQKSVTLIPPSGQFWAQCARRLMALMEVDSADYSALRVIVPAFEHARLLTAAMSDELGTHFIPPRINTMTAWLSMQLPAEEEQQPASAGERLMVLYAQLREHAWLKTLFSARKNTELLPLAQTLIMLSDELTEAMLPLVLNRGAEEVESCWHRALAQLPQPVQRVLSDEAQLVWQIWSSQQDGQDAISLRFKKMLSLADRSAEPLLWLTPVLPQGLDESFLDAYAKRNPVHIVSLDWRISALMDVLGVAWPEIVDTENEVVLGDPAILGDVSHVTTLMADSLEQEAEWGAHTILTWLQQGKSQIALIAQDRVVARRIRALLERAQVHVTDETGWKLSTTRAAAALAAWFDVVATRADTVVLLDLVKSPYFMPDSMATVGGLDDKSTWVMAMEMALLRANIGGGWEAIIDVLGQRPECAQCVVLCRQLMHMAAQFSKQKKCLAWLELTQQALGEWGILASWQNDEAGRQIAQLLDRLRDDCASILAPFTFSEWRAFVNLQLEDAAFQDSTLDSRVVMLPLNGARCRPFDAVLMAGCDAAHLPSQPKEVLFFTNAVRRECGLMTREQRQRQQLRDVAELLLVNPEVVLSWQRQQRGEDNPVSPWIERLNLHLTRAGVGPLKSRQVQLPLQTLTAITSQPPRPVAASLRPTTLSASGYNSFLACPYQFFATRMLGLSTLDSLSDMPEKRDYGGWLHAILKTYHDTIKAQPEAYPKDRQEALLQAISDTLFAEVIQKNPAALGYSLRWKKVIPAYIAWSQAHADSGWQFEAGELWLESKLTWPEGDITLRGQIDRVDKNQHGEFAVLDYKTNPISVLKKKLSDAEDQQLPFYGLLAGENGMPVSSAHYVPLEMTYDKLTDVRSDNNDDKPEASYAVWQNQLKQGIIHTMNDIARGASLPAQGISQVCRYCDVRGLCRKGAW